MDSIRTTNNNHTDTLNKKEKEKAFKKTLELIKTEKLVVKLKKVPVNIYLFKVTNRNSRKRCDLCSKLTIKIPERRH